MGAGNCRIGGRELDQLSPEDVRVETVLRAKSPKDDVHSPSCLLHILGIPGSVL